MHRRDALKALADVASAAGLTVTPITAKEAEGVEVALMKTKRALSPDQCQRLAATWRVACEGASLEHVKVLVLEDLDVEIVRQTRT